jgi:hypothetical protein
MTEKSDWIAFLAGLLAGLTIGGTLVYALMLRETRSLVKTFAYDESGRLIQVMREYGV